MDGFDAFFFGIDSINAFRSVLKFLGNFLGDFRQSLGFGKDNANRKSDPFLDTGFHLDSIIVVIQNI
jgi:hypothetical protein